MTVPSFGTHIHSSHGQCFIERLPAELAGQPEILAAVTQVQELALALSEQGADPTLLDDLIASAVGPLIPLAARGARERQHRSEGARKGNQARRRQGAEIAARATEKARLALGGEPPIGHSIWTTANLACVVWGLWGELAVGEHRPAVSTIAKIVAAAIRDGRIRGFGIDGCRIEKIDDERA